MGEDRDCNKCGDWRGTPITELNGRWVFVCGRCKSDTHCEIQDAERVRGA